MTRLVLRIAAMAAFTATANVHAVDLPIVSDFWFSPVGAPPPTGGPDEPTSLVVPSETSLTIEYDLPGFHSRVLVLDNAANGEYVAARYTFPDVFNETLRVEVTVNFGGISDGYFLQTGRAGGFAVAGRLWSNDDGEIRTGAFGSGQLVGFYEVDGPFRIRLDVHPGTSTYDCTIDASLDGFDEDNPVTGIPFLNAQLGHTAVDDVILSLNSLESTGTTIEYDDLVVRILSPDCPADLDGDGLVTANDLVELLASWGPCPPCAGDLDEDDAVGFRDLLALLAAWGGCG